MLKNGDNRFRFSFQSENKRLVRAPVPASTQQANVTKSNQEQQPETIRFRTALRNTVYDVMKARGWKEAENENDYNFFWSDVHWVHDCFDSTYFGEQQKINHFRNHYELTRKDLLVKNMKRLIKNVEKEFGKHEAAKFEFVCPSFVLPQEHALFQEEFKRNPGTVWIMKPVGKAQGKGIFLINKISQITQWRKTLANINTMLQSTSEKSDDTNNGSGTPQPPDADNASSSIPEAYLVQKYVENPYLIGGKKFDIRVYVLVTSYSPLTVYVHRNGFCRFSNYQFSMNAKDISNLYIHATNVAIQKTSPIYDSSKGCKWLLRNLRNLIATKHGEHAARKLFTDMEALIVRSLLSVQKVMIQDKHCCELYGYDILIDDALKPWLLEVNASPSVTADTQADYDLKANVLHDTFDIIDMEKRHVAKGAPPRKKVGGYDLVYHDAPVKHDGMSAYWSHLGCWQEIQKSKVPKKRFATRPG